MDNSKEKEIRSLLNETDLRNISKTKFISIASKLNELDPETQKALIKEYPILGDLLKNLFSEYSKVLNQIISSDDKSTKEVYGILSKEIAENSKSREEYIEFAKDIRSDISKMMDNPSLSDEFKMQLIGNEMELHKRIGEKEESIRIQNERIGNSAIAKDSEKKQFSWKTLGLMTGTLLATGLFATVVFGGKIDIKSTKGGK